MLNAQLVAFLWGLRGAELQGCLPDRLGILPSHGQHWILEGVTSLPNAQTLVCGMQAGPAMTPVTLEDQRGHGGLGCEAGTLSPPFVRQ